MYTCPMKSQQGIMSKDADKLCGVIFELDLQSYLWANVKDVCGQLQFGLPQAISDSIPSEMIRT